MEYSEWQNLARTLKARAQAVADARMARARALTTEAGLDGTIAPTHVHNALCDWPDRPWKGVDYSKVRRARWEMDRMWEAHQIVDRIIARAMKTIQWPSDLAKR